MIGPHALVGAEVVCGLIAGGHHARQQHDGLVGGEASITSKPGQGTKIVIDVPMVPKEAVSNGKDDRKD